MRIGCVHQRALQEVVSLGNVAAHRSGRVDWIVLHVLYVQCTHAPDATLYRAQMARTWGVIDRRLLFRGWTRLCLHAASLNAAEGSLATATAAARAARAEVMEKEVVAADEKAKTWEKAAAASVAAAAASMAREEALQKTFGVSTFAMELKAKVEEAERALCEQQQQRAVLSVRKRLEWSWSRACVRSIGLATLERNCTQQGVWFCCLFWHIPLRGGHNAWFASVFSVFTPPYTWAPFAQVTLLWREIERRMLFRGWNRLCLQSVSLSADEAASAATTAVARANRAAAMESEAVAADATAKAATATAAIARAREEALREACGVSTVLWDRLEESEQTARKQQEHRAIILVGDGLPCCN